MVIKTKFNIGDEVWTMIGCKAVKLGIESIHIYKDQIRYALKSNKCSRIPYGDKSTAETECFATRDELIAYISDDGNESV